MFLNPCFLIFSFGVSNSRELLTARPSSLIEAMAMAQLFEERIKDLMRKQHEEGPRPSDVVHRTGQVVVPTGSKPIVYGSASTTLPQLGGISVTSGSRLPV